MKSLRELLEISLEKNASDLHLVAGLPPCLRVYGELEFLKEGNILSEDDCRDLIFSILNAEQKNLLTVNKELDFSLNYVGKSRFRVNAYFQKGSLAASFRLIPLKIKKIDELGLPSICRDFVKLKQGFILVTGPTGHGKSTTLAAMVEEVIKERNCHVVTVEDPVEFVFESKNSLVSQRELHQDTHSWANALRSVLRKDPDVILIGEMRDYETMAAALTIAETGHLVLSTLHTNSSSQAVDRIIDSFPQESKNLVRLQLASTLEVVISQRLVPLISGGRVLACELLVATPAVRNSIREGKTHMIDNIIQTSASVGMKLLDSSLGELYKKGKISLETYKVYTLKAKEISKRFS